MLRIYAYLIAGWLCLVLFAIYRRRRGKGKLLFLLSYVFALLILVEVICLVGIKLKTGHWIFQEQSMFARSMFEPHPYLVGVGRPNAKVGNRGITYTHNSQGFRGNDFGPKNSRIRIVAIGGSTTYGIGVNDNATWPVQLEQLLGAQYEVFNFGLPGHSTAEHIAMLSLIVPDYKPDILLLHVGLNDLRNIHVKNLTADYSNYHSRMMFASLGFCSESVLQRFASGRLATVALEKIHVFPPCELGRFDLEEDSSPAAETRAKQLYVRNLETLITIAKTNGYRVVLVPQVLVRERFQGGRLKWWLPYIEDDQLLTYLAEYNDLTEQVAERQGPTSQKKYFSNNGPRQISPIQAI